MSKGSIFWGKSRGKLGEMVLSVVKGQQTQRAYNARPANPRTEFQMLQRMRFASAGKFFARSQQALFKMAFEGKKQTESDFNAFMRYNLKEGIAIYPTKEEVDDPFFPMIAPWRMSKGSLEPIGIDTLTLDDGEYVISSSFITCSDADAWYDWQPFFAENPKLREGDIITFCTMVQQVDITGTSVVPANAQPYWKINSIVVGADLRGGTVGEYMHHNDIDYGFNATLEHNFGIVDVPGVTEASEDKLAIAGCCIVSRQVRGKLQVSSEYLHLNNTAQRVFEFLSDDGNRAFGSWDTAEPAILQGKEERNSPADRFYAYLLPQTDMGPGGIAHLVAGLNPHLVRGDKVEIKISANGTSGKTLSYTWPPAMRMVTIGEVFGANQWTLSLTLHEDGIMAFNETDKTINTVDIVTFAINGKGVIDKDD